MRWVGWTDHHNSPLTATTNRASALPIKLAVQRYGLLFKIEIELHPTEVNIKFAAN